MKVILNQNVENLGHTGDVVEVSPGYARNFLIPNKKAIYADGSHLGQLSHLKKIIEKKAAKERANLMELAGKLNKFKAQFKERSGEDGKLFGSITNMDIEERLKSAGYSVDKRHIILEAPIKKLGSHEVKVKLSKDITATIKVSVTALAEETAEAETK